KDGRRQRAAFEEAALAREYLARLDEGHTPSLEDFLSGIPEPMREGVFRDIDRELANRESATSDPHLRPQVQLTATHEPSAQDDQGGRMEVVDVVADAPEDRWVRAIRFLVPRALRGEFLPDLLAERQAMRASGAPAWRVNVASLLEIFVGLAQRVPLQSWPVEREPPAGPHRRLALQGWISWRLFGPAVLLGKILGSFALFGFGLLALVIALVSVGVVATSERIAPGRRESRLLNGVLAGCLLAVVLVLASGLASIAFIGLGTLFGWTWLSMAAGEAWVYFACLIACAISISGWVPGPWFRKRLVRL
ncbi:MAG: hypothetical protein ACYTGV_04620, partial [Planctomycetota bacterium]